MTGLRHHQVSVSEALAFGVSDIEGPKAIIEEGSYLPYVVTKLEFDRLFRFESSTCTF